MANASLTPIQERLNEIEPYHPFSTNTFSDWAMEAGDIITVSREGHEFQSPVHSSTLTWHGKQQISVNSTGNKERESIAKVSKRKYGRGGAGMVNSQNIYKDFYSEDGYLASHLEMTESHLRTVFVDGMNSLRGDLEMTASHLRTEFTDGVNSLRGEFEITASHLRTEFTDGMNSLRGEFEVTASHLRTEFEDGVNSLRGEFEVTASGLRAEFEDENRSIRASIQAQANRIGLVVEGTGANAHIKAAQIVSAINDDGTSGVLLSADRITLDGTTKLSGSLAVRDGTLNIVGGAYVGGNLYVTGGNSLILQGSGTPATQYALTPSVLGAMIKEASASGNVLKLTRFDGTEVNFSKATSLSGEWSGSGTITVIATQNNVEVNRFTRSLSHSMDTSGDSPVMKITSMTGGTPPTYEDTGHNISMSTYLDSSYASNAITANGTYTPGTGKIGFDSIKVNVDATVTGAWEESNPQQSPGVYNKYTVRKGSGAVALSQTVTAGIEYNSTLRKYVATVNATGRNGIYTTELADTGAYNAGWAAARAKVSLPSGSGSTSTLTVSGPAATVGDTESRSYSLANNGNNAVKLYTTVGSVDVTVANYTHGKYDAGWGAARNTVSFPTGSGSSSSITVSGPSATVGSTESRSYSLANNGNNAVKLYTRVGSVDVTVANYSHNKYTAGYNAGSPASGTASGRSGSTYNWTFSVKRADNTTKSLTIDCSAIYSDARVGYYTSAQYTAYGTSRYNDGYSAGQTYGESIGIGGVHHMRLDYAWSSGGAHSKNWWNIYVYNSNETKSVRIQTDQSSTGLYMPIVMNHEFTTNGTFNPWSFTGEGGGTGVVFGPITVNVPTGSNPYPQTKSLKCIYAVTSAGLTTYRFEYQNTSSSMFKNGTSYKFHHNNGYT